jgi:hypothetical protein
LIFEFEAGTIEKRIFYVNERMGSKPLRSDNINEKAAITFRKEK